MIAIHNNDSATSGQYERVVTTKQAEALSQLRVIGWKWNRETVQIVRGKPKVRCYIADDGEFKVGQKVLIAEIEADGALVMGPMAGGVQYGRKQARKA